MEGLGGGFAGGAFAGMVNSFVVGPVEMVKCRLQVEKGQGSSSFQCLKQAYQEGGIRAGVMKGTVPTIFREVFAYCGQFGAY
jgi:solute carrier family 25 carnitine/acylcarnitine transporter 20/29